MTTDELNTAARQALVALALLILGSWVISLLGDAFMSWLAGVG